jgi:pimeloyl-[acyl-carrier protein] methyl ester esterase
MLTLSYRRFASEKADAPHLVLIHGWGLHSGVWDRVIQPLRAVAHLTLIDRKGYGKEQGGLDIRFITSDEEQQAILAIAPPCAIYIGWSLGGTMVLDIAYRYPERVLAVVAVASSPCFCEREHWHNALSKQEFKQFFQGVLAHSAYVTLMRFIGLQCQGSATQRDDMRFLYAQLEQCPIPHQQILIADAGALWQTDNRSQLQQLRCPVLWIRGEKDSIARVDMDSLLTLNPLIAVSTISEAAHVPFVSQPDIFVQIIKRFLHELQHDCF